MLKHNFMNQNKPYSNYYKHQIIQMYSIQSFNLTLYLFYNVKLLPYVFSDDNNSLQYLEIY
jgi:hypothetical protein